MAHYGDIMTKLARLEAYLKSGSTATPRQITGMFGLQNPTAAVHALRSKGVCVYANPAKLATGERTTKYRVGNPSKRMVQLAHSFGLFA
jgi:hypothetical protein